VFRVIDVSPDDPLDGSSITNAEPTHTDPDAIAHMRIGQALLNLPLPFISNAGQTDPNVRFTVKGAGHAIFFTPGEVVFAASANGGSQIAKSTWQVAGAELPISNPESQYLDPAVDPARLLTQTPEPEIRNSIVRLRFRGANPDPVVEGLPHPGRPPARGHDL